MSLTNKLLNDLLHEEKTKESFVVWIEKLTMNDEGENICIVGYKEERYEAKIEMEVQLHGFISFFRYDCQENKISQFNTSDLQTYVQQFNENNKTIKCFILSIGSTNKINPKDPIEIEILEKSPSPCSKILLFNHSIKPITEKWFKVTNLKRIELLKYQDTQNTQFIEIENPFLLLKPELKYDSFESFHEEIEKIKQGDSSLLKENKEIIRQIVFRILKIPLIEERTGTYVGCTKCHRKVIGTKCSCSEAPTARYFKITMTICNINNENDYVNIVCFDTTMKSLLDITAEEFLQESVTNNQKLQSFVTHCFKAKFKITKSRDNRFVNVNPDGPFIPWTY
ncbi:hypothetical protein EDI_025640 [Entamoeba dispar SAW760]|uniref:Replication factor A C-terminal domain-containing protein n=1 Tax=Entamoeba dispar (strain ATCC PRA-260 / SAW760) TaxID=370354 RepID=B0EBI6_ENTDS|nr:uncharacterized protein EDI_025640 [Entamoeba dispar SAW760]EDR28093.1 hypothetical protein EDI_025640 [Entamoeba dispar SAW760]|eukprot:EDR28093.1 hypothetical protein EDI_025640 [Entamoeba dispar SAW760]